MCSLAVCAWAWVSAAPRHSWLGFFGCVCVFLCALGLYPATPGWGVRCVGWVSPGTRKMTLISALETLMKSCRFLMWKFENQSSK